ncbi:hypothetical protein EMPS_03738 [Entomortierella parvispora]|uniref:Uncharacterized protein n=1 Tax=Entomortierella parvispora TaxID=205924 RepID=A0A9P3H7D0_9FUNG|nr:hypothetical protein EMPS_03738 [Entomortierella parvispora]
MIDEFRDKPCPYGGTLSAIIDATPEDLISKVHLEHKFFRTWFHKRSVLIGDGAINALQDATILANCLYDLKDNSQQSITAAFQSYEQRHSRAKEQYENSLLFSKILSGKTLTERLVRHLFLNYLPKWFLQDKMRRSFEYRPQATFLPMVPFKGTGPVFPQPPSKRYQLEQEAKKQQREE